MIVNLNLHTTQHDHPGRGVDLEELSKIIQHVTCKRAKNHSKMRWFKNSVLQGCRELHILRGAVKFFTAERKLFARISCSEQSFGKNFCPKNACNFPQTLLFGSCSVLDCCTQVWDPEQSFWAARWQLNCIIQNWMGEKFWELTLMIVPAL